MEARNVVGFLRGRAWRGRSNKSIVFKASRFLKKSISIAKTSTKPIILKMTKPRKLNPRQRYKLRGAADHYNYRFLEEYQLSPKRAPLVRFRSRSMILLCGCWGKMEMGDHEVLDFEAPAIVEDDEFAGTRNLLRQLEPVMETSTGECDWVDMRAEWFIAKFYQELRMENIT